MPSPFARNSKNVVIAHDGPGSLAPLFRPANQLRLVPAKAANPAVSDQLAFLPGREGLACMSGNGLSDNGLTSRAATQRLSKKLAQMKMMANAKLQGLGDAGSPNAAPVPYVDLSFQEATRGMVWSQDNPDAAGQVVATIPRNDFQSWQIVAAPTGTGSHVFRSELWQTMADGSQQQLDASDPMNSAQDAANYIQATEFRQNVAMPPQTNPTLQTDVANAGGSAAVRASQSMVPWTGGRGTDASRFQGSGRTPRTVSNQNGPFNLVAGADVNNYAGFDPGQASMSQVAGLGRYGSRAQAGRRLAGLGSVDWSPGEAQSQYDQDQAQAAAAAIPLTPHNMHMLSLTKSASGQQMRGSQPAQWHTPGVNPFGAPTPGGVPAHVLAPAQPTWQIVTYSQNNQIIYNAELVQGGAGGQRIMHKTSPDFTTMQDAQNWIAANPVPGATIQSTAQAVPSAQLPKSVPWQNDPFQANPQWSNNVNAPNGAAQTNLTPFEVSRLQLDGLGDTTAAAGTLFGFSYTQVAGAAAVVGLLWYLMKHKKGSSAGGASTSLAGSYKRKSSSHASSNAELKDDFLMAH